MLYQLSYEATDVGSRSILGSYVPVKDMKVNDAYEIIFLRLLYAIAKIAIITARIILHLISYPQFHIWFISYASFTVIIVESMALKVFKVRQTPRWNSYYSNALIYSNVSKAFPRLLKTCKSVAYSFHLKPPLFGKCWNRFALIPSKQTDLGRVWIRYILKHHFNVPWLHHKYTE